MSTIEFGVVVNEQISDNLVKNIVYIRSKWGLEKVTNARRVRLSNRARYTKNIEIAKFIFLKSLFTSFERKVGPFAWSIELIFYSHKIVLLKVKQLVVLADEITYSILSSEVTYSLQCISARFVPRYKMRFILHHLYLLTEQTHFPFHMDVSSSHRFCCHIMSSIELKFLCFRTFEFNGLFLGLERTLIRVQSPPPTRFLIDNLIHIILLNQNIVIKENHNFIVSLQQKYFEKTQKKIITYIFKEATSPLICVGPPNSSSCLSLSSYHHHPLLLYQINVASA